MHSLLTPAAALLVTCLPPFPFWSSTEVYYSSSSETAGRTWEMEIASLLPWSGFLFLSGACAMWGREELPFSPDHHEAFVTGGPWLSKGRKSQPPCAPSQSEVPEMRTKSLACSHSPQHRPNRNPGSFLLIALPPLYVEYPCGKGTLEISKKQVPGFHILKT